MGWYTELTIGEYNWSWRKSLPVEVPLLFLGKHKVIENEDITFETDSFIGYKATVGQVITNLDHLGLTMDFFKSIYDSYRGVLLDWGLGHLSGMKYYHESLDDNSKVAKTKIKEINGWINRLKKGTASNDIDCAIQVLKDDVKLESSLVGDESLIPSLNCVRKINFNEPNILEATTFGIFLNYAHENLPEIAWLYEIRLVLATLNTRSNVKLDLSEWLMEGGNLNIIEDSIETLSLKAKTYNKTFNAILGGDETYIKEFERVQLAEKWNKLKSIPKADLSKGTKLEDFIANLFHKNFGFEVIAKNLLAETEELDIVLKNTTKNEFIKLLNSPFILIECKNWSTPVGVSEARVFESKYRESGNKVNLGIFVAINGVTKPFKKHLNHLIRDGVNLIVIENDDIEEFIYSEELNVNKWLEKKLSEQFILK